MVEAATAGLVVAMAVAIPGVMGVNSLTNRSVARG